DSGAGVLVTTAATARRAKNSLAYNATAASQFRSLEVVEVDDDWLDTAQKDPSSSLIESERSLGPENLPCLLYTSGATGQPKAVPCTHRAIVNRLLWMSRQMPWRIGEVALSCGGIAFIDYSTTLLGALVGGATALLLDHDEAHDLRRCAEHIAARPGIRLTVVPSVLSALLEFWPPDQKVGPGIIICSGETLAPSLATRVRKRFPQSAIYNFYGMTEAAGDSAATRANDELETIGRPIANTK